MAFMQRRASSSSLGHHSVSETSFLAARTPSDNGHAGSFSEKYSLAAHPNSWGSSSLYLHQSEPDDAIHNPDPSQDYSVDRGGIVFTRRGLMNLGCLSILATGILGLFAGYPIASHFLMKQQSTQGGFNLGGLNSTGQIPYIGNFGLIDLDTPQEAYTKSSYQTPGDEWQLVFSDEFNQDGRTFYPGDDPYWEAVDLWYWQTGDLEWYDPVAATTSGGALRLKLTQEDPSTNHNMTYRSAMLQSWNKFCFTGGILEVAVQLPGTNDVSGFWPAVWSMGNLGRAGFGASLDGMWPYSYDSCDVGTLENQTYPGTQTPQAAFDTGYDQGQLSSLPGQRLSRCTCPGGNHPGPVHSNGDYVGRSAPELDVFEATINGSMNGFGQASQSLQIAPMGSGYTWANTTDNEIFHQATAYQNTFIGNTFQQTISGLSTNNQSCYELEGGCFSTFAYEYNPTGGDDAYITWVNNDQAVWTMYAPGLAADSSTEIAARLIPQEPMYIIANLGFSTQFGGIDFDQITLPATMSIDYIRVYQPQGQTNIGCDPQGFPTASYINTYPEAYTNANFTLFRSPQFNQTFPTNRLMNGGTC